MHFNCKNVIRCNIVLFRTYNQENFFFLCLKKVCGCGTTTNEHPKKQKAVCFMCGSMPKIAAQYKASSASPLPDLKKKNFFGSGGLCAAINYKKSISSIFSK
ncbi:hypothetical protein TNIN_216341 [Trichonephila inaurata madagascariensis]|uniref:Uncharacterized protein n=1 Tax=Trichonephila inaurata madagascariensis TaxID=2747483 RepID=A0A8X6YW82_9ARAC|nr:hypothetical protein TNIN_216341 [Trichonephila inaurata madagascariensis]